MQPKIYQQDLSSEFYIDEGCYIVELLNTDEDAEVSVARARLQPGKTTAWHFLKATVERYVILQGIGRVEVGEMPATDLQAGDAVLIPAGVRQRITNSGEEDLLFLVICSPRFVPEAYQRI